MHQKNGRKPKCWLQIGLCFKRFWMALTIPFLPYGKKDWIQITTLIAPDRPGSRSEAWLTSSSLVYMSCLPSTKGGIGGKNLAPMEPGSQIFILLSLCNNWHEEMKFMMMMMRSQKPILDAWKEQHLAIKMPHSASECSNDFATTVVVLRDWGLLDPWKVGLDFSETMMMRRRSWLYNGDWL